MSGHDGHTINVGPVTAGKTMPADPAPIDLDAIAERTTYFRDHLSVTEDERDALVAAVRAARYWLDHRADGCGDDERCPFCQGTAVGLSEALAPFGAS